MKGGMITLEAQWGRLQLQLAAVPMGRDLCVTLAGGDRPHIGAVALSQGRPSLTGNGSKSATTSVLALPGHKEDDLARALARSLATSLDASVCVACGIHLDDILPEELEQVPGLVEDLGRQLLQRLKGI
jgi:hypothetical protein